VKSIVKKELPHNIYSIDDVDVWRNDFIYPLPLSVDNVIDEKITRLIYGEYCNLENDSKSLFKIASSFLYIESFTFLKKMMIAFKMKQSPELTFVMTNHRVPDEITFSAQSNTFNIYRGETEVTFPTFEILTRMHKENMNPFWKRMARRVKWVFIYNSTLSFKRSGIMLYSLNPLAKKFIDKNCQCSYLISTEEIFRKSLKYVRKGHLKPDITASVKRFIFNLNETFKEVLATDIPYSILEKYENNLYDLFELIEFDLVQARGYFEGLRPDVRLYTGTAQYFTRIVSEVVREQGGKVTGFPHGGGLSGCIMNHLTFTEFATCDFFFCNHEKEAQEYRKYPMINDVSFTVQNGIEGSLLNIDISGNEVLDLEKISKVMYVDNSIPGDEYQYSLRSDLVQLDLQLTIIDILLLLKKEVIFKIKPKARFKGRNFNHLGYYGKKIQYTITPFTQVLHKADLFVFEVVGSSALYEAMVLTKKPIILFYSGYPKLTTSFKKVLLKRCYVINCYEDHRNRLRFDVNELRKILSLS
tara:strand:+ start:459 stop:2042 length:1584 start_codon:yes stop_codon:yes gene_type:complete